MAKKRKATPTRSRRAAEFQAAEALARTPSQRARARLDRLQYEQQLRGERITGKKLKRSIRGPR